MAADTNESPYPRAWVFQNDDPKKVDGDTFEGIFTGRIEVGQTRQYGEAPVAIFDVNGSERSLWLFGSVLKNALTKHKPTAGERVIVKFLGKKKGAQYSYNNFWVDMPDREKKQLSWDDLVDEEDEEVA